MHCLNSSVGALLKKLSFSVKPPPPLLQFYGIKLDFVLHIYFLIILTWNSGVTASKLLEWAADSSALDSA